MGVVASRPPRLRAAARGARAARALPYLLLAPALLTILIVFLYPLIDGIRSSTHVYRFGNPIANVGLQNYKDVLSDGEFRDALWTTVKFVFLAVSLETIIGLALAMFCAR